MEQPVVQVTTEVDADAETVWRALTTPALIREYFLGAEVRTDWKVGHAITFQGEWKGGRYHDRGEIRRFDAPRELSYTHWSESDGAPARRQNEHLVRFRLDPVGDHTRLTVTQAGLGDAADPPEAVKAEFRKNWETVLGGLKRIAEREATPATR